MRQTLSLFVPLLCSVAGTVEAFTSNSNHGSRSATFRYTNVLQHRQQRNGKFHVSSLLRSSTTEDSLTTVSSDDDLSSTTSSFDLASLQITKPQIELVKPAGLVDDNDDESPDLNNTNGDLPSWFEPIAWRGVIVVLCALWASNFAAAKLVMSEPGVDSSLYAVARFGVSAFALAPGAIGSILKSSGSNTDNNREQQEAVKISSDGQDNNVAAATVPLMDWETLKASLICGSWVAFGYLGQTVGLLTTTASRSCVICSMHCVFVAVIAEMWRVQRSNENGIAMEYDTTRLVPAALAVLGVAIVELKGAGGSPTIGDALSFAQPIGFGMGYLMLENIMSKKPEAALAVSFIKLSIVALASLIMFEVTPLFSNGGIGSGLEDFALRVPDFSPIISSPMALGGILYTGLITTALALWVESIAFAKVPATDASIILTTEPLIAAGVGAVTLGETFGISDYIGATLIIGACAAAVLMDDHPSSSSSNHDGGDDGMSQQQQQVEGATA